eukprot:1187975-Prorocentrum_minimum.AAC.1
MSVSSLTLYILVRGRLSLESRDRRAAFRPATAAAYRGEQLLLLLHLRAGHAYTLADVHFRRRYVLRRVRAHPGQSEKGSTRTLHPYQATPPLEGSTLSPNIYGRRESTRVESCPLSP